MQSTTRLIFFLHSCIHYTTEGATRAVQPNRNGRHGTSAADAFVFVSVLFRRIRRSLRSSTLTPWPLRLTELFRLPPCLSVCQNWAWLAIKTLRIMSVRSAACCDAFSFTIASCARINVSEIDVYGSHLPLGKQKPAKPAHDSQATTIMYSNSFGSPQIHTGWIRKQRYFDMITITNNNTHLSNPNCLCCYTVEYVRGHKHKLG